MMIKFIYPGGFLGMTGIIITILIALCVVISLIIKFFLVYYFSQLLIDFLMRNRIYFVSDFLDNYFSLKNQKRLVFFIVFFGVYIDWKMIFILMAIIFCSSYIEKK